ncbi:hypothetical protein LIER_14276 [Lithospermum erythrorhizon]|uniref:Uncharacterized protein n=1 Tax=Lithospermum erythrorhizon TaxID=34254 RepID=A0AAV3Q1U3_LITER
MNPIVRTKLGVLYLNLLCIMTTFPKASADCINGRCYYDNCSYEECDPDIKYPNVCGLGCHCLDYGDGYKCGVRPHEAKGTRCVSHTDCNVQTTKDVVGYCYRISGDAQGVCSTRKITKP